MASFLKIGRIDDNHLTSGNSERLILDTICALRIPAPQALSQPFVYLGNALKGMAGCAGVQYRRRMIPY